MKTRWTVFLLYIFATFLGSIVFCYAGKTSFYTRKSSASKDMPLDSPAFRIPEGVDAPQQVHITQGDYNGQAMIISWVTLANTSDSVLYSLANDDIKYENSNVSATTYTFGNYTSGFIHHCIIQGLAHNANYTYRIGNDARTREFWFITPPKPGPDAPYVFGVIGDLGQTYDSYSTLEHYKKSDGMTVLYVGDLSYADNYPLDDGVRWDTWGRFVKESWIWTAGNHEIEFRPQIGEEDLFKPFMHRFPTPFLASQSTSPLWYAIRRASAHIIVLSSYSAYAKYTPQWTWLREEFERVDRNVTPWLIILMHAPWYNSNTAHYMEGEAMRIEFETWFLKYKVDVVFAGHVHAYERSYRISNVLSHILNGARVPVKDNSAPVYLTIGDGGNIEGIAGIFTEPQPDYSAYREASFGHGRLEIKNRTHAHFIWHRNSDGEAAISDEYILWNQYWAPCHSQHMIPRRKLKKCKHCHQWSSSIHEGSAIS